MKTITRNELKSWLDDGREFTLIDTLPPDVYAQTHIAGAANACVYQMDILDVVGKVEETAGEVNWYTAKRF